MATASRTELPFHLQGNYAPVPDEVDARELPVTGAVPQELAGRFLRNGPNPHHGGSAHWFLGDGMLHGLELGDGRARTYRNRYVQTKLLRGEGTFIDDQGRVDLRVDAANTHVVGHAGRILALVENGFPYEVTPELDTVGWFDFDGRLTTAMTAHPKLDPATGELHFFGYGFMAPYLTYHVADRDGTLVRSEPISVPGPTMIHDFNLTEHHVIFMDLPIVFDPDLAARGGFGVMPRGGGDADVRWFDVEPCYVFHALNAYEQDGSVVLDVVRYPRLWDRSNEDFAPAYLTRWTVDLGAGTVKEEQLDDRPIEFPRVDPRVVGRPHRYGYALQAPGGIGDEHATLVKYDQASGDAEVHDFGAGREPGEPVFVPRATGSAEDDGWVLTYVYDAARDTSDFVILDAADFTAPRRAAVALPQRVPFGFHGSWIPDRV